MVSCVLPRVKSWCHPQMCTCTQVACFRVCAHLWMRAGAEAPGDGAVRLRRPDRAAAHRHSPAGPLHRTPVDATPQPHLHLALGVCSLQVSIIPPIVGSAISGRGSGLCTSPPQSHISRCRHAQVCTTAGLLAVGHQQGDVRLFQFSSAGHDISQVRPAGCTVTCCEVRIMSAISDVGSSGANLTICLVPVFVHGTQGSTTGSTVLFLVHLADYS